MLWLSYPVPGEAEADAGAEKEDRQEELVMSPRPGPVGAGLFECRMNSECRSAGERESQRAEGCRGWSVWLHLSTLMRGTERVKRDRDCYELCPVTLCL